MSSILLHYANERLQTKMLSGIFRSFAWDRTEQNLILAGNRGRILRSQGEGFEKLMSGTHQNLRKVSVNPTDGTALIVGNAGSVILVDGNGNISKVTMPSKANLRAASWNHNGTFALIGGNEGTLLQYSQQMVRSIEGGRANFRHIAWQPKTNVALITSNCFAEEFIPSPNLFSYDISTQNLRSLNEGRADLIGVDWKRDGTSALVVGYDVIWHNGVIAMFDGANMTPVEFTNKRIYPVAVSWNPTGEIAGIATATAQPGMGEGSVFMWNRKTFSRIFSSNEFFFSAVTWNGKGTELFALGSTATRSFNC